MYTRIKELRLLNNLTQKDISKKLKISQSLYSFYENSKRKISINILIEICKIYNTSPDYILGITDEKIPHKRSS